MVTKKSCNLMKNSLPEECFTLTYNLNGFKSRVNRQFLLLGSSNPHSYFSFLSFVLTTSCLVVTVQSCMV